MTQDQLNKEMDEFLNIFKEKQLHDYDQIRHNETLKSKKVYVELIVSQAKSMGLITRFDIVRGFDQFGLTPFGHEVMRSGGWLSYLDEKDHIRTITRQSIETALLASTSSIHANRSSIRTNRMTILLLTVTIIISGVGAFISWLDYDANKLREPLRIVIDSLKSQPLQIQIQANDSLASDTTAQKK